MTQPSRIDGLPSSIEGKIREAIGPEDFGIPSEFSSRAITYARWAAAAQAAKQVPAGWISVETMLPPEHEKAYQIVSLAKKLYGPGNYEGQGIKAVAQDWNVRNYASNYTHWMYLPAAPSTTTLAEAAEAGQVEAKDVAERVVRAIEQAYNDTEQSVPRDFLGEVTDAAYGAVMEALATTPASPQAPAPQAVVGEASAPSYLNWVLHPRTADLVLRFSYALAGKLSAAEKKYGYSDGWAESDWMDECREKLMEHIAKGDPRDVAAYCAFLWHHGASTAGAKPSMNTIADLAAVFDEGVRQGAALTPSPAPSAAPHQGADALREDAERYRWLRDKSVPPHNFYISVPDEFEGVRYTPDEVDAGIDAARAALAQHQAPQQGEPK